MAENINRLKIVMGIQQEKGREIKSSLQKLASKRTETASEREGKTKAIKILKEKIKLARQKPYESSRELNVFEKSYKNSVFLEEKELKKIEDSFLDTEKKISEQIEKFITNETKIEILQDKVLNIEISSKNLKEEILDEELIDLSVLQKEPSSLLGSEQTSQTPLNLSFNQSSERGNNTHHHHDELSNNNESLSSVKDLHIESKSDSDELYIETDKESVSDIIVTKSGDGLSVDLLINSSSDLLSLKEMSKQIKNRLNKDINFSFFPNFLHKR